MVFHVNGCSVIAEVCGGSVAMEADTSTSSSRRQQLEPDNHFHDDILDAYRLTAPRIHIQDEQDGNDAGGNVDNRNQPGNPVEMTVLGLRYAAKMGHLDDIHNKIIEMEEMGMPVDLRLGQDGKSAVHVACECGQGDCLRRLLEHNASPTGATGEGATPLMLAVGSEDLDTVDALLERIGPDEADYENNCGFTALRYAAIYTRSEDIINRLIRHGCDPNRFTGADERSHSPLYDAVLHNNWNSAGALLRAGASPHLSFACHPSPCGIALSHEELCPRMAQQFLPFLPWYRRRLVVMSRHRREAQRNLKQQTLSGTSEHQSAQGPSKLNDGSLPSPTGRVRVNEAPIPSPASCVDVTQFQSCTTPTDREIRRYGSGVRLGNGPPGLGYTMLQ